jgi:hypothetical protein
MDQKLLDALNNISIALEQLSESLDNSGGTKKSDVGSALQSGDFSKQLVEINEGIKSIKQDTKKILDNQETIIKLQKQQTSGESKIFEEAGGGKTKQMIKDGVAVIGLIAGAILAIGMAFKLIGDVNFGTVISITLALSILSLTFMNISTLPGLDLGKISLAATSMVIMSTAILFSSIPLSFVFPVSGEKALTAIGIAGVFTVFSYSMSKIIKSFSGVSTGDALLASVLMPVVMFAMSTSIFLSSIALSMVQPVSLGQGITAIMIAGVFTVISFGLGKIIQSLGKMNVASTLIASAIMPYVLVSLSHAISESSHLLNKIEPIGLQQGITAIMIAGVFAVISFGLGKLFKSFEGLNPATAIASSILLPFVLGALAYTIMKSSEWLSKVEKIGMDQFLTSIAISVVFVALSFAVKPILKGVSGANLKDLGMGLLILLGLTGAILVASYIINEMPEIEEGKLSSFALTGISMTIALLPMAILVGKISKLGGPENFVKGGISTLIVAGVISLSSIILNQGEYGNKPDVDWASGVGLSLLAFGISTVALGALIVATGGALGAAVLLAGAAAVIGVAGLIVGVSEILNKGNFTGGPSIDWATSVGSTLVAFAKAVVILGVINSVGVLVDKNPIKAGSEAVIEIANTMNKVGEIISKGIYTGGPTKDWAEGISIALGAFSPIYQMLVANKVMTAIFGSGVTVEEFGSAIKTISEGIVSAAEFFNGKSGIFTGGPTKEWSEGVGLAIGAFAPVYEILSKNSGWLKSGIKPEDFAGTFKNGVLTKDGAIQVILRGIVSAAEFLGANSAVFDVEKSPKKEWSESVGGAISAFIPVFEMISNNSGIFGDKDVVSKMSKGIISVSFSISKSSKLLSNGDYSNYPSKEWTDGITYALTKLSKIDNLNRVSSSFRYLGRSLSEFNNSIKELDTNKLDAIRSISGSVVMLSLMDPDMFESMMDKLEEKSGIFNQLILDFEKKKNETSTVSSPMVTTTPEKSELSLISSKMDSMIGLLSDMSSVVGSGGTLRDYLISRDEGQLLTTAKSDKRLKNIIRRIGISPLGINIYEFTYKFNSHQIYVGVIAQELIGTEFESALIEDKSGYYAVDYSKIDVKFSRLNK